MSTPLVAYRSSLLTPDTVEAMQNLERSASNIKGLRISYAGVPALRFDGFEAPGPTGLTHPQSMEPTGREVYISLLDEKGEKLEPAALWGLVVPLGFIPWSRYPVPGPQDQIFHYFGIWSSVIDFLHGEGLGEYAWSSVCCAAQLDVGKWTGDRPLERAIQANLYRLGIPCGPIDGKITDRTLSALKALGLGGLPLSEVGSRISKMGDTEKKAKARPRSKGLFTFQGKVEVFTSGGAKAIRTKVGHSVTTDGPGRVIFLLEG